MSRATRLFNLKSLSTNGKVNVLRNLQARVQVLEELLLTVTKSRGSNLVEGRFSLILDRHNKEEAPQSDDLFTIEFKEDQIILLVDKAKKPTVEELTANNPDLAAQIEAFKEEVNQ